MNVIRKEGGSRVIAITKLLPLDWQIVDIEVSKIKNDTIMLKIKRLK